MRGANQKLLAAARSPISESVVRLTIGDREYGPESIQSATVSAVTGDNGAFGVGSTEAARLVFTILTSALPLTWTSRDIRLWMGYNVDDDSSVSGETLLFEDIALTGDTEAVEGYVSGESLMGDLVLYVGDETAELQGEYSELSEDSTAEVLTGGHVEVETLYLRRYEYFPMGIFATNDQNVSENGSFTTVTAYDAFYWMTEQCGIRFAEHMVGAFDTRLAMSLIAEEYGLSIDLSTVDRVLLPAFVPTGTVREVIGKIAAACFQNARVDGNGVIRFMRPAASGIELGLGDFAPGSFTMSSDERVAVGSVATVFDDYVDNERVDTKYSYPEGALGSSIVFDRLLFGETSDESYDRLLAEQTIEAIGENAVATTLPISVKGYTLSLFGGLYLDLMDRFTCYDIRGRRHELVVMSAEWSYDGGISTTVSASATSDDGSVSAASTIASVAAGVGDNKTAISIMRDELDRLANGENEDFNDLITAKVTENPDFVSILAHSQTLVDMLDEAFVTDAQLADIVGGIAATVELTKAQMDSLWDGN